MNQWTDGYVADIPYTAGYYRELSPTQIALAMLLRGHTPPDLAAPLNYCELGTGYGISLLSHAAAFPHMQFFGTDFNPAHAAQAQAHAAEADMPNVHMYDDSFEQFIARDLPPMDIICLHGIYSWVSERNRRILVDFIERRLKPGGVAYISYNVLPGWAAAQPMRELMRLHRQRLSPAATPLTQQVKEAMNFIEDLNGKPLRYFKDLANGAMRIKRLKEANVNYLAHEYFNEEWQPFYFHEVAEQMSAARLSYVGPAYITDLIDVANLPPEAIKDLAKVTDMVMKETLRDFYLNQQFRRDLYVRGARLLPAAQQTNQAMDLQWLLMVPPEQVKYVVQGSSGEVNLTESAHRPVVEALASGPKSARQLQQLIKPQQDLNKVLQALTLLAGGNQIHTMVPEAVGQASIASAQRYNRALARRALDGGGGYVANPLTGQSLGRPQMHLMLADAFCSEDATDPAAVARKLWHRMESRGQSSIKDGQALRGEQANVDYLTQLAKDFARDDLPTVRKLHLF